MTTWEIINGVSFIARAETVSAMQGLFYTAEHREEIFSASVHASMKGDDDYADALLEALETLHAYGT